MTIENYLTDDEGNYTVYNVLTFLCHLINKNHEREYMIKWKIASENDTNIFLEKYKKFISIILNLSIAEYTLIDADKKIILDTLSTLKSENKYEEISVLILYIEGQLNPYIPSFSRRMIHPLEPLNTNFNFIKLSIYPSYSPFWNTQKSSRKREYNFIETKNFL